MAARFGRDADAGWYEGVALELGADSGTFRPRVGIPYYRLLDEHGVENGFGDLDAEVEWRVVRHEAWSFGPGVTATFPTGSAAKELGMGHTMLGGSIWATWQPDDWFLKAKASYVAAVGSSSQGTYASHSTEHAHGAPAGETSAGGSIPSPMSPYELALAANVGWQMLPAMRLTLGALGAVPTTESGSPRVTLTPGLVFTLGSLSTAVGVEADLAGSTLRRVVNVAVTSRW